MQSAALRLDSLALMWEAGEWELAGEHEANAAMDHSDVGRMLQHCQGDVRNAFTGASTSRRWPRSRRKSTFRVCRRMPIWLRSGISSDRGRDRAARDQPAAGGIARSTSK
jgi:hypothetical protein